MPEDKSSSNLFFKPLSFHLQRKCAHGEEEEKRIHRKEDKSEAIITPSAENYINTLSGGEPLKESDRTFFEKSMGYDFRNVQLHTDNKAKQSAKSINAMAYTYENNLVFNSNKYQPNTTTGKQLLAHELTHVIQQSNGLKNISRATYPIGNSQVHIDYGNVVFHDNLTEYEREIESRFTDYKCILPIQQPVLI